MFNYTHLSLAERKRLYLLQKQGQSIRQIAKHMGRSPSTISRELKRNSHTPTDQVLALPDKSSKSIHCEYYASATSF
jgi:IS30 family transposase